MMCDNQTLIRLWPKAIGSVVWFLLGWLSLVHGASSITVAWDATSEPEISGYRVHYGVSTETYTDTLDVGKNTSATVSNLTVGVTYFFAVTAYDNTTGLESQPSNEVSATVTPLLPPTFGGSYNGASVEGAAEMIVFMDLTVSTDGKFTARVVVGNVTAVVRGTFNAAGSATVQVLFANQNPWTLSLELNPENNTIAAHLTNGSVDLPLILLATPYAKSNAAPQAGRHTVRFGTLAPTGSVGSTSPKVPDRWGFATLTITPSGLARVVGRLADSQIFTAGSKLRADASFLLRSTPYLNRKGLLAGEIVIRDTPGVSDGDGILRWVKPVQHGGGIYNAGFDGTVPAQVSLFHPVSLSKSFNLAPQLPAIAALSAGDLPVNSALIQRNLTFPLGNTVTVLNPGSDRLKLVIHAASGLIGGSFVHPADGKLRSIRGVLFQKQASGGGFFRGIKTTGTFELTGVPGSGAE
jgi:hypothetical protein